MNNKEIPKRTLRLNFLAYFFAFLIPIFIVLIILYTLNIYPFGEDNLSTWDLRITYTYFNEWFKSVLSGNGTIFYSFSKSLGGNMFAGFSCLLTSPINWLIPLFGDNPVDFSTFAITIKFGFAGLVAYYYLKRRFCLNWYQNLALSTCYAMSLFLTTQSGNPMWMEAVIVLPLVMYGIYLLVNHGRVVYFFVTLLVSILLNFYNGYMICLFSIIFYLLESYLAVPNAKNVRFKIMINPGRFSVTYTLAILASVVILLPTVMGLMSGKGAVPGGLFNPGLRFDPNDLISAFYLGIYHKEFLPQLFTGTLASLGTLWYFTSNSVDKRERLAMGLVLGFMVVSTLFSPLERFWLGLRDGNSFYCRFAFLISFLLMFCTARILSIFSGLPDKKMPGKELRRAVLIISIGAIFVYGSEVYTAVIVDGLPYISTIKYVLLFIVTIALSFIYLFSIRQTSRKPQKELRESILGIALILVISAEMLISGSGAIEFRVNQEPQTTYSKYQEYYTSGHQFVASVNQENEGDVDAYRMEKTFNLLTPLNYRLALNETLAFNYRGLALYDSAYDDRVQNFLYRLGYTPDSYIRTSFNDSMIVADSIVGIKYMVSPERPLGYQDSSVNQTWEGSKLYQNPDVLPIGFASNSSILTDISYDGNPFNYQNELISALLGQESQVAIPVEVKPVQDNRYILSWQVMPPQDKDTLLFGYIEGPNNLWPNLYISDQNREYYLSDWSQGMFPITEKTVDGKYTVSLQGDFSEDLKEEINLHVSYVDRLEFAEAMAKLASKPFEIEIFEDGHVLGSYQSNGNEVLFTTIPYDVGWTVKVNDQVVEPRIAQETFIALNMQPGLNKVEMSYISPGFIPGVVVSLVSCALFVVFAVFINRRDKNKRRVDAK